MGMHGLDMNGAVKAECDRRLRELMRAIGASGGSVYAPVRTAEGALQGLAFVCLEPRDKATQSLSALLIPLHSVAGRCFEGERAFVEGDPWQDHEHFKRAEIVAQYTPTSILSLPLQHDGRTVGVLQLLRAASEFDFTDQDLAAAQAGLGDLGARLAGATG
jgi:GAF domain-containing protein